MNLKEAREILERHKKNDGTCFCRPYEPNMTCYEVIGFIEGYESGVNACIQILNDYPDITVEDLARLKNLFYEIMFTEEFNA